MTDSIALPALILGSRNQLHLLMFDDRTRQYVAIDKNTLFDIDRHGKYTIDRIARTSSYIFVVINHLDARGKHDSYLIQLNFTLEEVDRRIFQHIAALEIYREDVFISSEGDFIALKDLNPTFNILGRVGLQTWGSSKKNAHDIFIHQNIAYLLDNIEYPVFIFKVDISDLRNLQIIDRQEIIDCYIHLDAQWLNTQDSNPLWYILHSYSHRGGYGQNINIDDGSDALIRGQFHIFQNGRLNGESKISNYLDARSGTEIIAITKTEPAWAIFQEENERVYLAKVTGNRTSISLEKYIDLLPLMTAGLEESERFRVQDANLLMQVKDNLLYILLTRSNCITVEDEYGDDSISFNEVQILVVDPQEKCNMILNHTLELERDTIRAFDFLS